MKYTSPSTRFELTTLVVNGTVYKVTCKSNYHAISTTTVVIRIMCPNEATVVSVSFSEKSLSQDRNINGHAFQMDKVKHY